MGFLIMSLVLLLVSVFALLILNSHEQEKLSLLNQYWNNLSLGIGVLLIFIGMIYFILFAGLIIGKFSVTLPHLIGVSVLYMPAAIVLLGWLVLKTGLMIAPTIRFLNTVTYIAVSWILMQHIEMAVKPEVSYTEFGIIALVVSIVIFYAAISILRYRSRMKSHMLLPINLVPLLNAVFITFTYISLSGISASLGLFLTHVLSCLLGALVIIYFVVSFIADVRLYLR
jgi:hypothetical protein